MDSNTTDQAVSAFLIVASILYLVVYGFTLMAICKSKELIELPCYRIMVALGLCDMIQVLLVGLIPGCMMFVNIVQDAANKAMGAVLIFGWYGMMTLAAMLSINRLVTVAMGSDAENMFSGKKVFVWIGSAVVYAFGHFVSYCCPNMGMMYDTEQVLWSNLNTTESYSTLTILLASDSILISIMILCYICLGVVLKIRRQYASSGKLTKNDIGALVSAFLVVSNITANEAYFFFSDYFGLRIRGIGIGLWLICAGNPSIFYFAFNGTIRRAMVHQIYTKKVKVAPNQNATSKPANNTNSVRGSGTNEQRK